MSSIIPAADLPALAYHARQEISGSNVNALWRRRGPCTPAYARWYLDTGRYIPRSSAATELGQLLHLATLQPDEFEARVTQGPINESTGKPYGRDTKAWREWEAENPDAIALAKDESDRLRGMGAALRAHPRIRTLLGRHGENEVSCVWTDPETGVECRGRIDRWTRGFGLLDLKSARSADPDWFAWESFKRGYHRKAWMYETGWALATGERDVFTMPVVESSPPYGVCLYAFSPDAILQGEREAREVLAMIAECRRTGAWPGYPETVQNLEIPARERDNPTSWRTDDEPRSAAAFLDLGGAGIGDGGGGPERDADPFGASIIDDPGFEFGL